MTALSIITKARERLGDEKKQRWSDNRLLSIVNDGHKDICKFSNIYRRDTYIPLRANQLMYRLPEDCISVRRIEFAEGVLPLYTRFDIDNPNYSVGTDLVCIKDNLPMGELELYPAIPTDIEKYYNQVEGINTDETIRVDRRGVFVGSNRPALYEVDPLYGVLTDSSTDAIALPSIGPFGDIYSTNINHRAGIPPPVGPPPVTPVGVQNTNPITADMLGVLSSVYFKQEAQPSDNLFGFITNSRIADISGQYGVVTDIANFKDCLKVFYSAVPSDLQSINSDLVISYIWAAAMQRYVVGTALQDDNDANNIARGEGELAKYIAEVSKAASMSSKNFSGSASNKLHTNFRRI